MWINSNLVNFLMKLKIVINCFFFLKNSKRWVKKYYYGEPPIVYCVNSWLGKEIKFKSCRMPKWRYQSLAAFKVTILKLWTNQQATREHRDFSGGFPFTKPSNMLELNRALEGLPYHTWTELSGKRCETCDKAQKTGWQKKCVLCDSLLQITWNHV